MAQHRSVNQRLQRAKSKAAKCAVLEDWAKSWELEQMQLIRALGKAIADNDYDQECILAGELKAMSVKKFTALPVLLKTLTELINDDPADQ